MALSAAEKNAILMAKYGIKPKDPFITVTSQTQTRLEQNMQSLTMAAKPQPVYVPPPQKTGTSFSIPQKKRGRPPSDKPKSEKKVKNAEADGVPEDYKNLFRKPEPPILKDYFEGIFLNQFEAMSFAAHFENTEHEMNGFSHVISVPYEEEKKSRYITHAKANNVSSYYIHQKIVKKKSLAGAI